MSPPDTMPHDSDDRFTFSYQSDEDGQPMRAIIDAMAWTKDISPTDLEPLQYSINVDELNRLFGRSDSWVLYRASSDSSPSNHTYSFEYEDCTVTVTPDMIQIEPDERPRER